VKPGNIVKFVDRYEKHKGRMFLVLDRKPGRPHEPDNSKWAQWAIIDMTNGAVYHQIGRDLEVVNASR
jgi:hypothetical protein